MESHAARSRQGFTLIELLVVVSIIGLLVTILLPALAMARASASDAACRSNLRQAGAAEIAYAADYKRFTPLWEAGAGGPGSDFVEYLGSTVDDYADPRSALNCPKVTDEELDRYASQDPNKAVSSYALNPAAPFRNWDYKPERVKNPSQIALIAELPVEQSAAAYTAEGLSSQVDIFGDVVWVLDSGHTPERGFRHGTDTGNVVFNDGHVDALTENEFMLMGKRWEWSDYSDSRWVWWDVQNNDPIMPGNCACN